MFDVMLFLVGVVILVNLFRKEFKLVAYSITAAVVILLVGMIPMHDEGETFVLKKLPELSVYVGEEDYKDITKVAYTSSYTTVKEFINLSDRDVHRIYYNPEELTSKEALDMYLGK